MLDGLRRMVIGNNARGERQLISSPYGARSPRGMVASQSDFMEKRQRETRAAMGGDAMGMNQNNFSGTQTVVSKNLMMGMLEEFLPQDRHIRNRIFRDIYYHDAIAGGAVDIYSSMPWSDFYLVGLRDKEVLDTYHKSVENMRLKLLLPAISRDYLALGTFVGTTVYDVKENLFSAIMPQNLDFCLVGETKVLTDKGWQTIFELARPRNRKEFPIKYQLNGKLYEGSAPYYVGHKPVYTMNLHNGKQLTGTADERIQTYEYIGSSRRYRKVWKQLQELQPGSKVALNSFTPKEINKTQEFYEAFFIGAIMGDGSVRIRSSNKLKYPEIRLFGKKRSLLAPLEKAGVVDYAYPQKDGSLFVLFNHRAKELIEQYKLEDKISVKLNNFTQFSGYLSGLITTDGNVHNDINISGAKYLHDVLDMLLQYGCATARIILANKKGKKSGNGHLTKDNYLLHIGKTDCRKLLPNLWLRKDQNNCLEKLLSKNSLIKLPWTKVINIKYAGCRDVYDINMPKKHRFIANGVVVHNCQITEVPFYGMDPLIDLKIPEALTKIMSNRNDPRIKNLVDNLPDYMQNNFKGGTIPLMPENTLYIPRRTLSADSIGTSFYERILPVHLMEKALWRGSIDQAYRRQRAILHIMVGADGDDYVPTMADLEAQRDLWLAADMDPTGAIIVTRTGISPNEVRNASDFWRVDEIFDFFSSVKYRALGINEAFITGEAQFNVMDAAMTVFIEGMRSFRGLLTQEIFYEKIFPAIALDNDFTRDRYQMLGSDSQSIETYFNPTANSYVMADDDNDRNSMSRPYGFCADTRHGFNFHNRKVNNEDLAMPQIMWQKHLRPEGDQAYLEMLTGMQEKGIPVPLSAMAMAGGIDIYAVLNNQEEEIKLRKRVKAYEEKLADFMPAPADDGSDNAQASVLAKLGQLDRKINRFSINRPVGIFGREYDERNLPHNRDKTGKYRLTTKKGQQAIYERINRSLAKVMAANAERENTTAKRNRKRGKAMVSGRYGKIN